MGILKVSRPNRENKSKTFSMRLKQSEVDDLNQLKGDLGFESATDLIGFSLDILKKLHEWNSLNYRFFIGNPEKKEYREVEIEI
jgi:hypothetical protein